MLSTPYVDCDFEYVYEPAEDSFLLLDSFENDLAFLQQRFAKITPVVVEIGVGSGIVTSFIQQHVLPNALYIPTDLNPHACTGVKQTFAKNTQNAYLDPLQADLTANFVTGIDLLVFNPPYVPTEEVPPVDQDHWLDLALDGGKDGMVTTEKVLSQLSQTLSDNGIAYILFCARNNPQEAIKLAVGMKAELVLFRKAGWEELSVYKFTKLV